MTGFLFQQSTAEKFVIESSGFKRFFDKFASYLSLAAQRLVFKDPKGFNFGNKFGHFFFRNSIF